MAKILIVEDELVLLELLTGKLEFEGYTTISAKNGEEGLQKIRSERPDLVLMDIVMPKMTGFDVLREIAKDDSLKEIPIIIISNSGQPSELEEAVKLGAKDYLIKAEFNPQEVIEKMKKYLSAEKFFSKTKPVAVSSVPPPLPHRTGEHREPAGKDASGKHFKLLVVEDEKFLRELMVQKLLKEGFIVDFAIDGIEALKKVEEFMPDMVFLDLILPGMHGFDVLSQIKSNPKTAKIEVVILSNLGQREDIERGKALGAIDYMVKAHFTPDEIIEKAKTLLTALRA